MTPIGASCSDLVLGVTEYVRLLRDVVGALSEDPRRSLTSGALAIIDDIEERLRIDFEARCDEAAFARMSTPELLHFFPWLRRIRRYVAPLTKLPPPEDWRHRLEQAVVESTQLLRQLENL